jgi:glycosyltransferase involved in cell wall biosynthesis
MAAETPAEADVYWMLSDWRWDSINPAEYSGKKVVVTVHHIVPEKFDVNAFKTRDKIVDLYHVYNERTEIEVKKHTNKPVVLKRYWANQERWQSGSCDKKELRRKFGLPEDGYFVGSFQRDTEGSSLKIGCKPLPKKEKGPQEFVDFIVKLASKRNDVVVVLGGWRRQFVTQQLNDRTPHVQVYSFAPEERLYNIRRVNEDPPQAEHLNVQQGWGQNVMYTPRYELTLPLKDALIKQQHLNELYRTLDLYAVTARHEGGPQALIECGLLNVPVVSTPVGIAEQVLPPSAISDDVSLATPAIPNVKSMMLPQGIEPYRKMFEGLK